MDPRRDGLVGLSVAAVGERFSRYFGHPGRHVDVQHPWSFTEEEPGKSPSNKDLESISDVETESDNDAEDFIASQGF